MTRPSYETDGSATWGIWSLDGNAWEADCFDYPRQFRSPAEAREYLDACRSTATHEVRPYSVAARAEYERIRKLARDVIADHRAREAALCGRSVRMTESFKAELRANGCGEHVDEFGACTGVVVGPVDYGNGIVGPDVDVRWQPSGLRYGYMVEDLELIDD